MDVINKFNKLYYTVSNTVSQIASVLPGNAVTKDYEVCELIASGGPGLLWKIYSGYKKSTREEASVFVFEKKILDNWSKDDRENMLNILRRSIIQLTKIRHPRILTVHHPLEESRDSLAFATEPVFCSLDNIFGNYNNLNPIPKSLANFKLHDIEIKYGLMQVIDGMMFLNYDVKLLHKNISPDSIIVDKFGNWKIFGFDYCAMAQTGTDGNQTWPFVPFNTFAHVLSQPKLEFIAPEVIQSSENSPASDIYSLGCLIYCIYSINHKPMKVFGKDISTYKRYADDLSKGVFPDLTCIPEYLSGYVKLMLRANPAQRPNLYDVSKLPIFEEKTIKTLLSLDTIFQLDNLEKSKFFKSLPDMLKKYPHRINFQHVLPCLTKEFTNPQMIPFILPSIICIAENCTDEQYAFIYSKLKPIMKLEEPIQIILILMKNIDLLIKLTPKENIEVDLLPMLFRAQETQVENIQKLSLSIYPTVAPLVTKNTIKTEIIPRIRKLCLGSDSTSMNVCCVQCVSKLLDCLDKWIVLDNVLPFIIEIKSRDPVLIVEIMGILKSIHSNTKLGITKDLLACKVIPFLMPICVENKLDMNQFEMAISMVKEMVDFVETEHRNKLKLLSKDEPRVSSLHSRPRESMVLSNSSLKLEQPKSPDSDLMTTIPPAPASAPLNPYTFTPKPQVQRNTQPSVDFGLNAINQTFKVSSNSTLNNSNTLFNKPTTTYPAAPNYTLNTQPFAQLQTNPSQSLLPQSPNYMNNSQSLLKPLNSNKANNNHDAKPSGLTAQEIMDFLN
ncbi:SCY1-like protein 2 [Pseudolycoriella hygida]|uniref:SCY1-like protein 2 n=1 Tax=Pseudolycoriella hygida TaxID=35572 RepID=A0A9Q0MUU9_9DIPT|nr:SCY1-like protein 2 [Pseudolycoriella hygida]